MYARRRLVTLFYWKREEYTLYTLYFSTDFLLKPRYKTNIYVGYITIQVSVKEGDKYLLQISINNSSQYIEIFPESCVVAVVWIHNTSY